MTKHVRLTMAQALVRYLANQRTTIDAVEQPLFAGIWAIFGHGNVAGMGEALWAERGHLPTYRAHNEQAMAHAAIAFAKTSNRRRMMACTSSIGPGGYQHGYGCRLGACEPAAGLAAAGGCLRQPAPGPGPATD